MTALEGMGGLGMKDECGSWVMFGCLSSTVYHNIMLSCIFVGKSDTDSGNVRLSIKKIMSV